LQWGGEYVKSKIIIYKIIILYMFIFTLGFQKVNSIPYIFPMDEEGQYIYSKKIKDKPLYKKEVFLTFDDGPSRNNTPQILKILKEHYVKGTFFIVGKNAEQNPDIVRSLHESGMSIIAHSHSHDYNIYKNTNSYLADLYKCNEVIKEITNEAPLPFTRLPGGSDNRMGNSGAMEKIRKVLKEKELSYVDWNVSSSDAAEATVAMSLIKENVISQCKYTSFAVILMHDSAVKTTTVEALPYIIRYLKNEKYVFRTFSDITNREYEEMVKRGIINR
jgi:peptidoglycan-N-acetylglucosamine deacetylase